MASDPHPQDFTGPAPMRGLRFVGVPYCSTDDCDQYDGKRCMLMGLRPGHICEPAVINLVAKLRRLEAK